MILKITLTMQQRLIMFCVAESQKMILSAQ